MASVLLYGGSFDPIHHGHLIVSRAAAERLGIERVILIPAATPPHKDTAALTPAADRLAMCRLAVEGDPLYEVSDWEAGRPGPNYTLDTVRHFRDALGEACRLYWLLGMDSLRELGSWHRPGELAASCTLVTAVRPGYDPPDLAHLKAVLTAESLPDIERHVLPTPMIDIEATAIRRRVQEGRSIRYLVPEPVRKYIAERDLYAGAGTPIVSARGKPASD